MEEVSQSLSGCHRMRKSSNRGGKCTLLLSDVTRREDDMWWWLGGGGTGGEGKWRNSPSFYYYRECKVDVMHWFAQTPCCMCSEAVLCAQTLNCYLWVTFLHSNSKIPSQSVCALLNLMLNTSAPCNLQKHTSNEIQHSNTSLWSIWWPIEPTTFKSMNRSTVKCIKK